MSTNKPSLHDFLVNALEPESHLRKGQHLMNELHRVRVDMYINVPPDPDAFYDDSRLWAAVEWIKANW